MPVTTLFSSYSHKINGWELKYRSEVDNCKKDGVRHAHKQCVQYSSTEMYVFCNLEVMSVHVVYNNYDYFEA